MWHAFHRLMIKPGIAEFRAEFIHVFTSLQRSGVGTKFTLEVQKGVWSIVFMTLVSKS